MEKPYPFLKRKWRLYLSLCHIQIEFSKSTQFDIRFLKAKHTQKKLDNNTLQESHEFHLSVCILEGSNLYLFESSLFLPLLILPANNWINYKEKYFLYNGKDSVYKFEPFSQTRYSLQDKNYLWFEDNQIISNLKKEILDTALFFYNNGTDKIELTNFDISKDKDFTKCMATINQYGKYKSINRTNDQRAIDFFDEITKKDPVLFLEEIEKIKKCFF